ncbi:MAG: acyl-CoA dehydrogenase C-terminal domain-containing protein [Pseudomonadota bacterium]
MTGYQAPIADQQFILHRVLKISESHLEGFSDLDADTTGAILAEAGRLAEGVLAPLNATGDREGCRLDNGIVRTPEGFRDAYAQMSSNGWVGLHGNPDFGGQGMPNVIHCAVGEMFAGANMAFNICQGLTYSAQLAIDSHGSASQKQTYLPPLLEGRWSGTMNLTEPQCGTDLGLIRTRAEAADDGSYRITGSKIWISFGDHDLTENIVHLVLARMPDAPPGTKGLSLFIVPKFLPGVGGGLAARNAVTCTGLERKMGLHGSATCAMSYDGATGWLMGAPNQGMRAMFTMMNDARLNVGLQGVAIGHTAYSGARNFARERLQGRAFGSPANPAGPADPIIVHPDVRRGLLDQKSLVEGGRAFIMWGALLLDRARRTNEAEAEALVSLLTPVIKGFLTDKGVETTLLAQQTMGGMGYVTDGGAEQHVRDARVTTIYEGTNGVQSLDLVGRKLPKDGGRAIMGFFGLVQAFIDETAGDEEFKTDFLDPLDAATEDLKGAATWFMANAMKAPENALAGSYDFLHLFGHVCLGYLWARMAHAASQDLISGTGDPAFLHAKLATGRYFMRRQLPATRLHRARIESGAESVMALEDDAF